MTIKKISVLDNYQGRRVLLTGATGFLGKVLLAMMLNHIPNIGRIYVLLRSNKQGSALTRFIQEILSSPTFNPLQKEHRAEFSHFIAKRVKVITGDVTLPNLGLSDALASHLYQTLDLVFHLAGLVKFFPDIRQGLDINVRGTLEVAEFVKKSQKAALVHVSTCYVTGCREGDINESVELKKAPNGQPFDAETEWHVVAEKIEQIAASDYKKESRRRLIELGRERASLWGWSNSYCYTKALAEMLLLTRYSDIRLTIVRPSIIETAVSYPFSGWNEGMNTSAPLTYIAGGWYPYILSKKHCILDIIPVDYVSSAITLIGAGLLQNLSAPLYQLASSNCNPCDMELVASVTRTWHRRYLKKNGVNWLDRHVRTFKKIKLLSCDHPLLPSKLIAMITKLEAYFSALTLTSVKHKLSLAKQLFQHIDKVYRDFRPFTYDYVYRFRSDAIMQLVPEETLFEHNLSKLNWSEYWLNIHIPGMNRWIYPLYTKNKVNDLAEKVAINEEDITTLHSLSIM